MIQGFKDPSKLLYHYTSMQKASEHIIRSRTLRFGSFRNTNDPKESKNWKFDLGTNQNRDLGKYNQADLSRQLSDTCANYRMTYIG